MMCFMPCGVYWKSLRLAKMRRNSETDVFLRGIWRKRVLSGKPNGYTVPYLAQGTAIA